MRLRRLRLQCYGSFDDCCLEFSVAPGCLNLVTAPNGAGKSVLREALGELLFDFHPQTPMNFRFDYPRMRLEAEAVWPDGTVHAFVRRKRKSGSLTTPDDKPAPPSLLAGLPERKEQERLKRLFMLDSAQLRAGGRALLQSDGDLADALLSAAGDLVSARTLAADLARQRDETAPQRRAAGKAFHAACDAWSAATATLNAAVIKPAEVVAAESRRDEAAGALAKARERLGNAVAASTRIQRVRVTSRLFTELDAAVAWLAAHPDAPRLPSGAAAGLRQAITERDRTAQHAREAADEARRLAERRAAIAVDEAVLALSEEIERLEGERSKTLPIEAGELQDRLAERDAARREAATLLRTIGSVADPAEAASELRTVAAIAAARELIGSRPKLEAEVKTASDKAATEKEGLAAAEEELAGLPLLAEVNRLAAEVDAAAMDGDPGLRLRDAESAAASARAAMDAALARLPAGSGLATAIPGEITWRRLDRAREEAASAAREAGALWQRSVEAVAAAAQQLADHTGGAVLATEAAVQEARARRDEGWRLVMRRLASDPDRAGEVAFGAADLLQAYPRAVAFADELADQRITESDRIATAVALEAAIGRARGELAETAAKAGACNAAVDRAERAWAEVAIQAGLPPDWSLAEVQTALKARETAIEARKAFDKAAAELGSVRQRQAEHARVMAELLGEAGGSLAALLAIARQRVAEAQRVEGRRAELERSIPAGRKRLLQAQADLARAKAELASWARDWESALVALRRPAGETPAATGAVLDALTALPGVVRAAATAQERIGQMERQAEMFRALATHLAQRLGEPPGAPSEVTARLRDRKRAAEGAAQRERLLAQQHEEAAERAGQAEAAAVRAEAALARALDALGATSVTEAEWRLAEAAERETKEALRDGALLRLTEVGDGRSLDALRDEARLADPALLAVQAKDAEAEREAAEGELAEAAKREAEAGEDLRRLAAGRDAAAAAAARASAEATLARVLDDAMVQHLAATILEHALQAVEQSSTVNSKLLAIGDAFARLTNGSYLGVKPARDEGPKEFPKLLACAADGSECHVSGLSEGTRDQLYLGLRIVAIGDYVGHALPLPFVADDVLQTFDDKRARSALEALVALSQHVQVIVLTHHPHLQGIAAGLPLHSQTL